MTHTFEYTDDEHRDSIIAEQTSSGLFLTEVQILTNGNFLVFTDEAPKPTIVYTQVPADEFESMKQALDELILGGGF